MLKKRERLASGVEPASATEVCKLGTTHPGLLAHLVDQKYEDGSARQPGSITIFAATEGGLKACLNDKDTDEIAFVAAPSLTALLKRINEGITSGTLDWRTQRKGPKRK